MAKPSPTAADTPPVPTLPDTQPEPATVPVVSTAPDDNADLVLGDDKGALPEVAARPEELAGIIPKEDRQIPPTLDPAIDDKPLPPYFYARATVNLPGFDLWAYEVDEELDDRGRVVVAAHRTEGWVPNNEEGVHAVELGWAEIIDAPAGEEPPTAPVHRY